MNERYPTNRPSNAPAMSALSTQPVQTPPATPASESTTREKARTSLAVALHYNGRGAPRVAAKGGGVVAQKIIETARQHGVPLEEDAALAGALSRVDLGREIPRELWIAVAHVLTFAWSVAGKKKP